MNISNNYPFNFPLPLEISLLITPTLSGSDLLACTLVSKKMKELAENDVVWPSIALKEKIILSKHLSAKEQVKGHCCRFTQLFCLIFPQENLSGNWFERYIVMKEVVSNRHKTLQGLEKTQKALDEYIGESTAATKAVPEKIGMLIDAGGRVGNFVYEPIFKVINKIKEYSKRESSLNKKYKILNQVPLTTEDRQELMHSLKILQAFIEGNGTIAKSNDTLALVNTALQYRCIALTTQLISLYTKQNLFKGNFDTLLTSLTKSGPYLPEELPLIEEAIKMLLKTGAGIPNFEEKLKGIGLVAENFIPVKSSHVGT